MSKETDATDAVGRRRPSRPASAADGARLEMDPFALAQRQHEDLIVDDGAYRGDRPFDLFEDAPVAYLEVDATYSIARANRAALSLLGDHVGNWNGTGARTSLLRLVAPSSQARLLRCMEAVFSGHPIEQVEIALAPGPSRSIDTLVECRHVDSGAHGATVCLVALLDISAQKAAERRALRLAREVEAANLDLVELARRDPLTGLLNRRGLESRLREEASRSHRTGAPLSAMLADCDHFKEVNDTLGHATGDVVLREISGRLATNLRPTDIIGRVGGDEFLILLPDTTLHEAADIGERLRLAVNADAVIFDRSARKVAVSIGLTRLDPEISSLPEVIAATETALRVCKRFGRNRVAGVRGTPPPEGPAPPWTARGLVTTVCQPIVRLRDMRTVGHELLSRPHPDVDIGPADMFRAAADNGHLTFLDLKCLRRAMRRLRRAPTDVFFHVNIFPSTLLNTPTEILAEILGSDNGSLDLSVELSELQALVAPEELVARTSPLRARGIGIVMDDVGYGNSSIEVLLALEPDAAKIDKRMTRGVCRGGAWARALERLLGMFGSLGVPVVAEGVETAEEVEALARLGVPFAQGHYFGKPAPPPW